MAENKDKKVLNVPNIRFKEFKEEWKRARFKDVITLQRGSSPRPIIKYLTTSNEGVNWIKIGDMPISGRIVTSTEEKITKEGAKKSRHVYVGDLILSNSMSYGLPYIMGIEGCIHDGWFVLRDYEQNFNKDYLCNLLISDIVQKQYKKLAAGGVVQNISSDLVNSVFISIPSLDEQRKIAGLLSLIDERIATQNKIIDKLESLIKGLNQQLLYNNKWKTYKIKDIADIGRGRVISSIEIEKQHQPKYPVYSSQTSNNGIMGYLDDYMFDGEYITWTTDGANAGTVFYRNGKFNCTNVCGTLKINQEHNCYFVSLVLQQSTHYYVSTNLANPKLMNNTMASIKIKLPNIEEQNYLSKIFFLLNEHLYTNIRINKFYLEQKQYLLRQMFI